MPNDNPYKPATVKPWHRSGLAYSALGSFGLTLANVINGISSRVAEGGHTTMSDVPAIFRGMYLTEWWTLIGAAALVVYTIFGNVVSVTPPALPGRNHND